MLSRVLWRMGAIGLTGLLMMLVAASCSPFAHRLSDADIFSVLTKRGGQRSQMVIGHVGGPALAVAAQGSYVYLGGSGEFTVVDVGNPARPQAVWQEVISVNDILLFEDRAFVGGHEGIYLYDLSRPHAPRRVHFRPTPSAVLDLELVGNRLYAAVARDGVLQLGLDLIDHGYLTAVAPAQSLAAVGTRLIVASEQAVSTIDLAEPRVPRHLGTLSMPGRKEAVVIDYPFAYVAGEGGLAAVVLDAPEGLTLQAVAEYDGIVHGASLAGSCAAHEDRPASCIYVAAGKRGLCVVPLNDGSVGAAAACQRWDGSAWGLAAADGLLYVADGDGGLAVFSEPQPRALPVHVGSLARPGAVWRLAAGSDGLFVQSGWHNRVQSIQTGKQPVSQRVEQVKTVEMVVSLAADEQRLCLVSGRGLSVFEIDESMEAGLPGFLPVANAVAFVLDGERGHLLTADGNYLHIDLQTVDSPRVIAQVPLAATASDLAVVGESVAVALGPEGVALVGAGDQPTVQVLSIDGWATHLAANGRALWVGTGDNTIHQFSMVDGRLSATGRGYELSASVQEMTVIDELLIVADAALSVHFFDTDTSDPAPIKTIALPFLALDLATNGQTLYIADGLGGLFWVETDGGPARVVGHGHEG